MGAERSSRKNLRTELTKHGVEYIILNNDFSGEILTSSLPNLEGGHN